MGEANRRKTSGEMDFWYHGTDEHFSAWGEPPLLSKYKPELTPHHFISLSKDQELATCAGETSTGLCRSKLVESANILDLRSRSDDVELVWKQVVVSDIGRIHMLAKSLESFVQACVSGEILRLQTTDQRTLARLIPLQALAQNPATPIIQKMKAHLEVQNFTRQWIESVISPAKHLGYQGVICAEIDRYRPQGPKACLNLYIFDPRALTTPEWLSVPDEEIMSHYMKQFAELTEKNL